MMTLLQPSFQPQPLLAPNLKAHYLHLLFTSDRGQDGAHNSNGAINMIMSWSAKLPITDSAAFPAQKGPMLLEKTHSDDFAFPQTNHLIITTTRGVFSWSSHGVTECFRSSSEGIVAARKANDGTGLLAIADSQVVLLHDINKGMQKSYRLKGSDVGVL